LEHRFQQIYSWLEEHKPKVILDIGTWNGTNAIRMMQESKAEKYIGFDIWEEGSEYLDEIEFNNKERVSQKEAEENFEKYLNKSKHKFEYELIKGNTRVTLEEYVKDKTPFVDFVLIDGGHSTPTISSDLQNAIKIAKTTATIFVDDYYFGIEEPNVGSNAVMGALNAPYKVLPKADKVTKKGMAKLVQIEVRDLQIIDRWDVPEEESWRYEPGKEG